MKIVVQDGGNAATLCSFEEGEQFETIHDLTRALMESEHVHFVYEDDEGDSVTVSSHDELAEGVRVAREERRDVLVLNVTPELPGGTSLSRTSSNSSFVLVDDFGVEMASKPNAGEESGDEGLVAAVASLDLPELVDVVDTFNEDNFGSPPAEFPPPPPLIDFVDVKHPELPEEAHIEVAEEEVKVADVPEPAENRITNPEKEGYVPLDSVLNMLPNQLLEHGGTLSPVSDADDELSNEVENTFESEPSALAPDYVSEMSMSSSTGVPPAVYEPQADDEVEERSAAAAAAPLYHKVRIHKQMRRSLKKQAKKDRKRVKSATKKALKAAKHGAKAARRRAKEARRSIERDARAALDRSIDRAALDQHAWTEEKDEHGQVYFYNHDTDVSVWDKPPEMIAAEATKPKRQEAVGVTAESPHAESKEAQPSRRVDDGGGARRDREPPQQLSTMELKALYADFLADSRVQAEVPNATLIAYSALKSGQPLMAALNAVFDQCVRIANHALVVRVRADLPRVVHRVAGWVPTLVSLGDSTLQLAMPHILNALPRLFDGGRDLDVNLDHLLDIYKANPDARHGPVGQAVHTIARQQGGPTPVIHQNVICDLCGKHPIVGIRFKCVECADFDVCESCEEHMEDEDIQQKLDEKRHAHRVSHAMLKMRLPVTRGWAREFKRNFAARGSGLPTAPTPMRAYARGSYDDAGSWEDESRCERRRRRRFGGRRRHWDNPWAHCARNHYGAPPPHGPPPMWMPPHGPPPMGMPPHGPPPMGMPPHGPPPMGMPPHGPPPPGMPPRMHTVPMAPPTMPPPGLVLRQHSHFEPQHWWRNNQIRAAHAAQTQAPLQPFEEAPLVRTARREVGRPRADFVRDVSMPDRSVCRPGTQMVKTWQFINAGSIPWPNDTMLVHVQGDLLHDANLEFPVSACQPGQKCDVTVVVRTPHTPGRFVSYYRLKEPLIMGGKLFGEKVWVDFFVEIVEEESESAQPCLIQQVVPPLVPSPSPIAEIGADEESEQALVEQALVEALEKCSIDENENENENVPKVNENVNGAPQLVPLEATAEQDASIALSQPEQAVHYHDVMLQQDALTAEEVGLASAAAEDGDMPPLLEMTDSVMSLNSWRSPHRDEVKSDVMEEVKTEVMEEQLPSAPPALVEEPAATSATDSNNKKKKKKKTARELEEDGVRTLVGMGFTNEQLNRFMLQKYENDVQKVVDWLLAHV